MLFSTGSNSGKTFCGGEEGKRHFPLFKSEKRQKGSLGQSVSTNFDADCGLIEPAYGWNGSVILSISWEKNQLKILFVNLVSNIQYSVLCVPLLLATISFSFQL